MRRFIASAGLALLTAASCCAGYLDESFFKNGAEAYRRGDFAPAAEEFHKIESASHVSGELYYNLGNCYFKLNDLGRAILYYERSMRLLPRDRDLLFNIETARNACKDRIPPEETPFILKPFAFVTRWLTVWELTFLNVLCAWLWLIAAALRILFRAGSRVLSTAVKVLLGIQVVLALCWALELHDGAADKAVILESEVAVHSGPGETFPESFKIHEGVVVQILERQGDWSRVMLSGGLGGWLKSDDYERIADRVGVSNY